MSTSRKASSKIVYYLAQSPSKLNQPVIHLKDAEFGFDITTLALISGLVVSGFTAYYTLEKRVTKLEAKAEMNETKIKENKELTEEKIKENKELTDGWFKELILKLNDLANMPIELAVIKSEIQHLQNAIDKGFAERDRRQEKANTRIEKVECRIDRALVDDTPSGNFARTKYHDQTNHPVP